MLLLRFVSSLPSQLSAKMSDDDLAVLLQQAITELQESRKQTETLVAQNLKLVDQNTDLTKKVTEIVDSAARKGRKKSLPKVEVSVYIKVKLSNLYTLSLSL